MVKWMPVQDFDSKILHTATSNVMRFKPLNVSQVSILEKH